MYKIILSDKFKRESKRFVRKYRSLEYELEDLFLQLQTDPTKGISLGESLYKIRLAVKSKGAGKSGGMRAIYFVFVSGKKVVILRIIDKSEQENISESEKSELAHIGKEILGLE